MKSIKRVEIYFKDALRSERLRFTLENNWLEVTVKTPVGYVPSVEGYKYTLVCAQNITEYKTPIELCNRITNMLTEQLLSSRQDVNGILKENTLVRKDGAIAMSEQEDLQFYELPQKLANSDDMANMTIINKANELLELIEEL